MVVLTVVGKKETETTSKVEVEGVLIAETQGGNAPGLGGGADTTKTTVTFVVAASKKWKVSSNAEALKYAQVGV
jgi:hypothetical protein